MDNARKVVLKALLKINEDNAYSNIVIDNFIKKSNLNSKDISLASAIFYGVLERKITLDYIISNYSKIPLKKISLDVLEILRIGIYQIIYMDKIPDSAAVNECVKLAKNIGNYKSSGFINGILRSVTRTKEDIKMPDENKDEIEFLSVKYSCPKEIILLWVKSYGKECTKDILKSLSGRPPLVARVNNLKNSKEELIEKLNNEGVLAKENSLLPGAIELMSSGSIENLEAFKNGDFHIQDLASQICCDILSPKEGQTVVDVCAAPGGKSFTIAENMNNKGKVLSFDIYEHKVNLINNGASRLGISIIESKIRDAKSSAEEINVADRVLCDVPCSGLGIIRRKPEIRYKKNITLDSLSKLQYRILYESSKLVKLNGILIYSTCTLNPAENNDVANRFLLENKDFCPACIKLPEGILKTIDEPENQLTLMPQTNGTDGFFVAAFKRMR